MGGWCVGVGGRVVRRSRWEEGGEGFSKRWWKEVVVCLVFFLEGVKKRGR